jgi:gliding motility-associated-like protein
MTKLLTNTNMRFFFFLIFLSLGLNAFSRHIVGGVVTYKCLGGQKYAFTMKVYRDCYSGGADFDQSASIGVFRGALLIQELKVRLATVTRIDPPTFACLTPPGNVCVDEGVYQWELDLPKSNQVYTVAYQRCCRNNTITNIQTPGSVGATYAVEISPDAQGLCNNSPEFKTFPPILICANEPLVYDHAATDADGDQLVYEFCSPLVGGGRVGSDINGSPSGCDGVSPTPPCYPFGSVVFTAPTYTSSRPLGGNPIVKIDPVTGLITGTPTDIGQFVVGVCVKEYRNGVLLSTLRRDFQFNVVECKPTVRAIIGADELKANKVYLKKVCGNRNVKMQNLSIERKNILTAKWTFEFIPGFEFNEWEPVIAFPDTGVFKGQLILNPGTACGDTATIFVEVFEGVRADFTYSYDTCVAGPVSFKDQSEIKNLGPVKYKFDLGDGTSDTLQNFSKLYKTPGVKFIDLQVIDGKGCKDIITKEINWYPVPPVLIIQPSTFNGCSPANINFLNLSTPIDTTYKIIWDFGDGTKDSNNIISPNHIYTKPGIYSISIKIQSPIGCKTSASFSDWIQVRPGITADFIYSPTAITNQKPTVNFYDKSNKAISWQWIFNSNKVSFLENPIYTFRDTGLQKVRLTVVNEYACKDTIEKILDVVPIVTYFVPNAFTPNNDATNDLFLGRGITEGMKDFSLKIYTRWGEKVFETTDPYEGWNGQFLNTGSMSPEGVYVYLLGYREPRGKVIQQKGFATLLK